MPTAFGTMTPVDSLRMLVEEEISQVPLRTYPMVALLTKQDAYQSEIKWTVNVGGATASGRATDAASALTASADTNVGARLSIGTRVLGHRFDVLRNDIIQARRTAPGALRALFQSHVAAAFEVILNTLNGVLYTGTGNAASHGVFGLTYITTAANAVYAELSSATYADWVALNSGNNGTNRALSRTLLGSHYSAMVRRGAEYDAIFTTPELVEKYAELFAAEPSTSVTIAPQGAIDLGFGEITYRGRPVIADPACPNNRLFFVNSRNVSLYSYNLAESGPNSVMADSQKTLGMNFLVAELPSSNPHVVSYEISLQPALRVYNRRKDVSVMSDITQ